MKTYISLFSSAGVGCYAFKLDGFECVATNELIERRLNIQKINNKCKYDSGYICGDIAKPKIKNLLFNEVAIFKKKNNIKDIDVVIATPPCQGMSVANHKKNNDEIIRNSLVVESIKIIKDIKPKFFIFENVPLFLKTICTDVDGANKSIYDAIDNSLGKTYSFRGETLNFKNYGSNSSRTRTIVIGVRNDLKEYASPIDFFPDFKKENTLYEVIGHHKRLTAFNEFDVNDFYHSFRPYPDYMRSWIHDLKEGESAFDNKNSDCRPYHFKDGIKVENVRKNGDKYTRQFWNKVGPCIHTRNDQLASQNTIHPEDDRVFSIRELMELMTIPHEFKWIDKDLNDLNNLSQADKIILLKKEEINIRQSIGEAVPTNVMRGISTKISNFLSKKNLSFLEINNEIESNKLFENGNLINYLKRNVDKINFSSLTKIIELSNAKRNETSSFYTDKYLIDKIYDEFPTFDSNEINVLEPSVGGGSFIPYILKKYQDKRINLFLCDIDQNIINALKVLQKLFIHNNLKITYICGDYLSYDFSLKFDLIIGNPPFSKVGKLERKKYFKEEWCKNNESTNLASYFLEKSIFISSNVCLIMPKNLLNTPEYNLTRKTISKYEIKKITDFGEKGFKDVLVETICILINTKNKPSLVVVESCTLNFKMKQKQSYITDCTLPYWIIYRDNFFDDFVSKMKFGIFECFRDRQLSNQNSHLKPVDGDIEIIKSRNISDNGMSIRTIDGYSAYIDKNTAKFTTIYKYLDKEVLITPNMTYKVRVAVKPKGKLTNGSVALLIPKTEINFTKSDLLFFSSDEYRNFMNIARNYQTRSLNVDATSVYFYGIRKEKNEVA